MIFNLSSEFEILVLTFRKERLNHEFKLFLVKILMSINKLDFYKEDVCISKYLN